MITGTMKSLLSPRVCEIGESFLKLSLSEILGISENWPLPSIA